MATKAKKSRGKSGGKKAAKRGGSAKSDARFSPDIPGGSEPTDTTCEAKAYRLRVTLGGSSFEAPIDPPTPVCEHGSLFFDNFSAAG